jgi:hypothetical protein
MRQEEPVRSGPFANFVLGPFDHHCTLVIVLNAITTFFDTNWQVLNWAQDSTFYDAVDIVFVIFYTIELALKLALHRWYFFWNDDMAWNWFDVVLVCSGIYDGFLLLLPLSSGGSLDLVFLRILRLLKMAKILRVFRLIRALSVLRLMLNSLLGSLSSLFWSIVMMVIFFFMFALVFVQNTANFLADHADSLSNEGIETLVSEFGSVQKAMLGLFMALTGGNDWGYWYEILQPMGSLSAMLYLFYVAFSQIAMMNILTGIFVENALTLAVPDRQAMFSEEIRRYNSQILELEDIVRKMDANNDSFLTLEEFKKGMADESPQGLRTYLGSQGIHEADAEQFYQMLVAAHFGQKVGISSFVGGCMKLAGNAQSLDLQALIMEMKIMHKTVHDIYKELKGVEYELDTVEHMQKKQFAEMRQSLVA